MASKRNKGPIMSSKLPNYQELTIMIVDDDDVDALGIERALKQLKILNRTIRAKDGQEGLAMLRDGVSVPKPFLILLDINMPRMNGLEMLVELRKDEALANSLVFILTTSRREEDIFIAYKENVTGYIVKSRIADDFTRVIDMLDHFWRIIELPT
jgi:CheY-like chemotaxis protein